MCRRNCRTFLKERKEDKWKNVNTKSNFQMHYNMSKIPKTVFGEIKIHPKIYLESQGASIAKTIFKKNNTEEITL